MSSRCVRGIGFIVRRSIVALAASVVVATAAVPAPAPPSASPAAASSADTPAAGPAAPAVGGPASPAPAVASPAGPLATLTIVTRSLEAAKLFYLDGFGLMLDGPFRPSDTDRKALAQLWHVPADLTWTTYVLYRPGVRDAARIRLLVTDRPTPSWRRDWEPAVLGPYSIGFPNVDQTATDLRLRALGFGARNAMERSPFQMADGRTSEVQETVHTGPDFVAGVGIARGGGNPPISPIDPRGLGGPAYSMMVVPDVERMATFLRDVLGWEIRMRRVQASAGRTGALNTPDGTEFELAQLYPPGARHGFIILLQFRNLEAVPPPNPPRLPNAGLTLYSFAVEKLEPVLERAAKNGATQVTGPVLVDSAPHGRTRHATFVAPNGVMFEVYEPAR